MGFLPTLIEVIPRPAKRRNGRGEAGVGARVVLLRGDFRPEGQFLEKRFDAHLQDFGYGT